MKNGESRIVISSMPVHLRVIYGTIAIILVLTAAITYAEYGISVPEAILFAICALAACYEERWVLDDKERLASFRCGLVFFARTKKIPYGDILEIRTEKFEKGFRKTSWTRISVIPEKGSPLVIDALPTKKAARLTGIAEALDQSLRA